MADRTSNFSQKGFTGNFLSLMKKLEKNELCCLDFLDQIFTIDSSSTQFTGKGTQVNPLISTSKISSIIGNILTLNYDGLYVSSPSVTGASNGVSLSGNNVVLGQNVGQIGSPGKLLNNRETPFNGFSWTLTGLGQVSAPSNFVWFKSTFNPGGGNFNTSPVIIGDANVEVWGPGSQITNWANPALLISKNPGNDFDNVVGLEMSVNTGNLNGWLFLEYTDHAGQYLPNLRVASNALNGQSAAFNLDMIGRDSLNIGHFACFFYDYNTYTTGIGTSGASMPNSNFLIFRNGSGGDLSGASKTFFYINKNYSFFIGPSTTLIPIDNGARLQIFGDVTTEDPGNGQGKWKIGKLITASVTADLNHYIEVMIDGVLRKIMIAN